MTSKYRAIAYFIASGIFTIVVLRSGAVIIEWLTNRSENTAIFSGTTVLLTLASAYLVVLFIRRAIKELRLGKNE